MTRRALVVAAVLALTFVTPATAQLLAPHAKDLESLQQPKYPPGSMENCHEGHVIVLLTIEKDGSVSDAKLDKSSGYDELDQAALATARKWILEPGTLGGVPQRMKYKFGITFRLDDTAFHQYGCGIVTFIPT